MNSRADRYWLLVPPERLRPAAGEAAGHPHRGAAVALLGYGLNPHLAQRLQQLPQGPLAEAVRAGQEILSFSQGDEGREEAHGGAGVAQVNRQRRRQPAPASPGHPDGRALPVDPGPQLRQGLGRELGVFRGQGVGEDALPRGQGRGHQGPVGVALGPGQGEGGLDLLAGFDFSGHGSVSHVAIPNRAGSARPTFLDQL